MRPETLRTHISSFKTNVIHLASNAFDDGSPTKLIGFSAILNATQFVVQLLAPLAGFSVAKLV